MVERTQINFRVDNNLLSAIRTRCSAEGVTQAQLITNALKTYLGISPTPTNGIKSYEISEIVAAEVKLIEKELAELKSILGNNMPEM